MVRVSGGFLDLSTTLLIRASRCLPSLSHISRSFRQSVSHLNSESPRRDKRPQLNANGLVVLAASSGFIMLSPRRPPMSARRALGIDQVLTGRVALAFHQSAWPFMAELDPSLCLNPHIIMSSSAIRASFWRYFIWGSTIKVARRHIHHSRPSLLCV